MRHKTSSASELRKRVLWHRSGAILVVGMILAVSACATGPAPIDVDFTEAANVARITKWIAGDGADSLQWEKCDVHGPLEENQPRPVSECAEMTVPVDWFGPGEGTTKVAIHRIKATGTPKGDLLLNPGGPGESGTATAAAMALDSSAQPLLQHFNLIGFDPRGVPSASGTGDPLTCGGDPAPECEPSTKLEHYASTASVAHDMEYLRILLGDAPLNYLGYSYGTYLGGVYARLFPASVGAMVLDGPAPAESFTNSGYEATKQIFAQTRERFLQACVSGELGACPFTGTVQDAEDQIAKWSEKYSKHPLELEDGIVVNGDSLNAYFTELAYESRAAWPVAAQFLVEVMNEDEEALGHIAQSHTEVDNSIAGAVLCAIKDVHEEPGCAPQPVYDPSIGYSGATTIIVIALTGDPATPYADAAPLVEQLSNAVLVTVDGEGHRASYDKSQCASQIATDYFVSGTVPPKGTRCSSDK